MLKFQQEIKKEGAAYILAFQVNSTHCKPPQEQYGMATSFVWCPGGAVYWDAIWPIGKAQFGGGGTLSWICQDKPQIWRSSDIQVTKKWCSFYNVAQCLFVISRAASWHLHQICKYRNWCNSAQCPQCLCESICPPWFTKIHTGYGDEFTYKDAVATFNNNCFGLTETFQHWQQTW